MQKPFPIHDSIDASIQYGSSDKERIWWNASVNGGNGAWQTLAFIKSGDVYGLKIYQTDAALSSWTEVNVLNGDCYDNDGPDNMILIMNYNPSFRYDCVWSPHTTMAPSNSDNKFRKEDGDGGFLDNENYLMIPGGCLHVVFYDNGTCGGAGHSIYLPNNNTNKKVPGIYHMAIQYYENYEPRKKEDGTAPLIKSNCFVKNFDYANSALNDRSGEEKGLSPWKNHHLIAPILVNGDGWRELLTANGFPNNESMNALHLTNNPLDDCTLDLVTPQSMALEGVAPDTPEFEATNVNPYETTALMFNYLAKIETADSNITWDRICTQTAIFGKDNYSGWGPYWGKGDILIEKVGATSLKTIDWIWGHTRVDVDLIKGAFGTNTQTSLVESQVAGPETFSNISGCLSTGFLHPYTFFGARCGYTQPRVDSTSYWVPSIMGMSPNRWTAIADWNTSVQELVDIVDYGTTNDGYIRFLCTMESFLLRMPQGQECIDQTMNRQEYLSNIYQSWEINSQKEILGFDFAMDPRESEQKGIYAYVANGLENIDYNVNGGSYYINYIDRLSPVSNVGPGGANNQYGETGTVWWYYLWNRAMAHTHENFENPFNNDINVQSYHYNNRKCLVPEVTEWAEWNTTDFVDGPLTYPERDGNYSYNTSGFTDAKGATGKISIAIAQQRVYGGNFTTWADASNDLLNHSITDKMYVFISCITGENFYRGTTFEDLLTVPNHTYHEDTDLMDSGAGRNIRLFKAIYLDSIQEFSYSSELINFGRVGKIRGLTGEYKFGMWDDCKLQIDIGGDPRSDWIYDNVPNASEQNEVDDIRAMKCLNMYVVSNSAGGFTDNSDGYNVIEKHTLDLMPIEDEYSVAMFSSKTYVEDNTNKVILYDHGDETSYISSFSTTDDKDLVMHYNHGLVFNNDNFISNSQEITTQANHSYPEFIPFLFITNYGIENSSNLESFSSVVQWHNYHKYIDTTHGTNANGYEFERYCIYESIKNFTVNRTADDLHLVWKTPWVIYTASPFIGEEYQKIVTVPSSYTIKRALFPIISDNWLIAETLEEQYENSTSAPGMPMSLQIQQDPGINYYYAIRMNFDMPYYAYSEEESGNVPSGSTLPIKGVPSITDSLTGMKQERLNTTQVIATSSYAALQKNEDKIHIGLGGTSVDIPKWAGIPNVTFMGQNQNEVLVTDAELKSPDLGVGIADLDKIITLDDDNIFHYGFKRGEPYIYRIVKETGFTERSNKILNPNGEGTFPINSMCAKRSEDDIMDKAWVYSTVDLQRVHTFQLKGVNWGGLIPMPNTDATIGLKIRFSPDNTPMQYDGSTNAVDDVKSVFNSGSYFEITDLLETHNSGTSSYRLWFMITPKQQWLNTDAWYGTSSNAEYSKRGWYAPNYYHYGTTGYADAPIGSIEESSKFSSRWLFNADVSINRRVVPYADGQCNFTNSTSNSLWTGDTNYAVIIEDKTPPFQINFVYSNYSLDNHEAGLYNTENEQNYLMSGTRFYQGDNNLELILVNNRVTDDDTTVWTPGMSTDSINSMTRIFTGDDWNSNDKASSDYCNYINLGHNIGPVRHIPYNDDGTAIVKTHGMLTLKDSLLDLSHIHTDGANGHWVGFWNKGWNIRHYGELVYEKNSDNKWRETSGVEVGSTSSERDKQQFVEFDNGEAFMYVVGDGHKGTRYAETEASAIKKGFQLHKDQRGVNIKCHNSNGDFSDGTDTLTDVNSRITSKGVSSHCFIRYGGNTALDTINLKTDKYSISNYRRITAHDSTVHEAADSNDREIFIATSRIDESAKWSTKIEMVYDYTGYGGIPDRVKRILKFWDPSTNAQFAKSRYLFNDTDSPGQTDMANWAKTGKAADVLDVIDGTALGEDDTTDNLTLHSDYQIIKFVLPKVGPGHNNRLNFIVDGEDGTGSNWVTGASNVKWATPGYTSSWMNTKFQGAEVYYKLPFDTAKVQDGPTSNVNLSSFDTIRNNVARALARACSSEAELASILTVTQQSGVASGLYDINGVFGIFDSKDSNGNPVDVFETTIDKYDFNDPGKVITVSSSDVPGSSNQLITTAINETYQKASIIVDSYKTNFSSTLDYTGYILSSFGDSAYGKFQSDASTDVTLGGGGSVTINTPISVLLSGLVINYGESAATADKAKFKDEKEYQYKMSFVYDKRQESPLSSKTWTSGVIDGNSNKGYNTLKVDIELDPAVLITRVNRVNIYRIDNDNDIYRLVKSLKTDTGFSLSGGLYRASFFDTGTKLVSYEALNGISENIQRSIVHWQLSTQINNQHIVAKCYIPETNEEVPNYIFKSKTSKFDQFDWSRDYGVLPTIPTAIKAFAGKLFAFDAQNTYVINPNDLRILDTIEGTGCVGPRAIIVTDFGMAFFDENNIYIHDGQRAKPIGMKIIKSNDGFIGWQDRPNKNKMSLVFNPEKKQFIVFESSELVAIGDSNE